VLDHPNTSTACLKSVLTKHKKTLEVAKFTNVAFAFCETQLMYEGYEPKNQGCTALKEWVELEFELDEFDLTCLNCGCNLWPCCVAVGGMRYCC
jgi:hypothetical protein